MKYNILGIKYFKSEPTEFDSLIFYLQPGCRGAHFSRSACNYKPDEILSLVIFPICKKGKYEAEMNRLTPTKSFLIRKTCIGV